MRSTIQERLFVLQDPAYRTFHSALMPTVSVERIIGVRIPQLRRLARELSGTAEAAAFLNTLPHWYYEENNLHALLLEQIKEWDMLIEQIHRFLPLIDNWATCDLLSPKLFRQNLAALLPEIERWLSAPQPYTVRFGIGMLMRFYLDDAFDPTYPIRVCAVSSTEYYVKMMVAWYFATALAKQPDAILPFFEQKRLERWTHNKAIQKSLESNRIPAETKKYLRMLKIK